MHVINENDDNWDKIIKPQEKLLDFNFDEIWHYRDLLRLLVRRDFVSVYKQTIFGPIWFFIQPIFTTITFVFVFGKIAGISTEGIPQPLFYLAGITIWSYFSECLIKTSTVLRDNAGIFGKVYFPRIIMPISIVFSSLIKFTVQFALLILILVYYYFNGYALSFSLNILYLPFLIISMSFIALGLGLMVSGLTTKYRDLALLLSYAIQLLMYLSPVAYPLSSITSGIAKKIIILNPISFVIEGFRKSIFDIGQFNFYNFIYVVTISIIILLSGITIFSRAEKNFIDTI